MGLFTRTEMNVDSFYNKYFEKYFNKNPLQDGKIPQTPLTKTERRSLSKEALERVEVAFQKYTTARNKQNEQEKRKEQEFKAIDDVKQITDKVEEYEGTILKLEESLKLLYASRDNYYKEFSEKFDKENEKIDLAQLYKDLNEANSRLYQMMNLDDNPLESQLKQIFQKASRELSPHIDSDPFLSNSGLYSAMKYKP